MTSPVTPASTSPDSPDEAQALQASPKPAHRLSFSVAALLADTRKTSESSTRQDAVLTSPRSSPIVSYAPIRQEPRISKHPCDFKTSRYILSSSPNLSQESKLIHCISPHGTSESRTPSRYPEAIDYACNIESPGRRSTSDSVDYRMHPSADASTTPEPIVGCSSSPKIVGNHQDADSQSPRSSSHSEGRSRCSETDDIEEDDESRIDVGDLQHPSSPIRPTPAYLGGFATIGGIPEIPPSLHPAVWGGGHQNAAVAAAAAAAAATATFFPSHFSHHTPLNGKFQLLFFICIFEKMLLLFEIYFEILTLQ